MFFTVKIEYTEPIEGTDESKKANKVYLVDAVSVTDAEAKLIKVLPDNYKDKRVTGVTPSNVSEIVTSGESDNYLISRISYPTESSKGKIKMASFYAMVNGKDVEEALKHLKEKYMSDSSTDYAINSISTSNIICDEELVKLR